MSAEVILVHGLWYGPWALAPLADRLRRAGYGVRRFAYRPTAATVAEHARALAAFSGSSHGGAMHFVGHSLGGLVILQLLATEPALPPGRVVLLGTPLRGSRTARRVLQLPAGRALLGAVADDLCRGSAATMSGREVGMVAGSKAVGLGRLLGRPQLPSDGTVDLCETAGPGLSARVVLPLSHTGMLFSGEAARQVAQFLESGLFPSPELDRGPPHS
jgi:pimeloyl-ACP methyl ester carboxylesterase